MHKAASTALVILAMAGAAVPPARAASIGLAAPLSGTNRLLGEQMRTGADAAIAAASGRGSLGA